MGASLKKINHLIKQSFSLRKESFSVTSVTKRLFLAFGLSGLIFFLILNLVPKDVLAWTEPSASPPGGNVAAPLNTSGTGQTKSGRLEIGTTTPILNPGLPYALNLESNSYPLVLTDPNAGAGNKRWGLIFGSDSQGKYLSVNRAADDLGGANQDQVRFYRSGETEFRGNVGIGIANPSLAPYSPGARVLGITGYPPAEDNPNTTGVLAFINNRTSPRAGDNIGQIDFMSLHDNAPQKQSAGIVAFLTGPNGPPPQNGFGSALTFWTKEYDNPNFSEKMRIDSGNEPLVVKNNGYYFFAGANRNGGDYVDIGAFHKDQGWKNLVLNRDNMSNVGIGTTNPQATIDVPGPVWLGVKNLLDNGGMEGEYQKVSLDKDSRVAPGWTGSSHNLDEFKFEASVDKHTGAQAQRMFGAANGAAIDSFFEDLTSRVSPNTRYILSFWAKDTSVDLPGQLLIRIAYGRNFGNTPTGQFEGFNDPTIANLNLSNSYRKYSIKLTTLSAGPYYLHFAGFNETIDVLIDDISLIKEDQSLNEPALMINTDGLVGIGTANPQTPLHVRATGNFPLLLETSQTAAGSAVGAGFSFKGGEDTAEIRAILKPIVGADFATDLELRVHAGSWNTGVYIKSNGKVGIGTTDPGSKLTVTTGDSKPKGSSTDSIFAYADAGGTAISAQQNDPNGWAGYFSGDVYASKICFGNDKTKCKTDWPSGGGASYWTLSGSNLLYPNQTNYSVAIGGTGIGAPFYFDADTKTLRLGGPLQMAANFNQLSITGESELALVGPISKCNNNGICEPPENPQFCPKDCLKTEPAFQSNPPANNLVGQAQAASFIPSAQAATQAGDKIYVQGGNLRIDDAAGVNTMVLINSDGSATFQGNVQANGSTGVLLTSGQGADIKSSSPRTLHLNTDVNADVVLVGGSSSGNVGIGTTGTQHGRVTIEQSAVPLVFRETGQDVTAGGLWRMPLDGGGLRWDRNTRVEGDFGTYHTPLVLDKGGDVYLVPSSGNVGIGTTGALSEKLTVNGNIKVDNWGNWIGATSDQSWTYNQTSITTASNVGIGTTGALSEKLTVNGNIKLGGNEGDIKDIDEVIGYNDLFLRGGSASNQPIYLYGSESKFYTSGTLRMTISSAGLDLVGMAAVDYLQVHQQGGAGEGGEIQLLGEGSYGTFQIDNYQGNARIHTLASGKQFQVLGGTIYVDGTGGNNYFAGNVGIGTTGPSAKLTATADSGKVGSSGDTLYAYANSANAAISGEQAGSGWAGYFAGKVGITGGLTIGGTPQKGIWNSRVPMGNAVNSVSSPTNRLSMTIGQDGLPIIVFYDTTAKNLVVVKCRDLTCSPASAIITVLDEAGTVGFGPSIAIGADGLPVISYYYLNSLIPSSSEVVVVKCSNIDCSSFTTIHPTTTALYGESDATSIVIGIDTYPVIAYTRINSYIGPDSFFSLLIKCTSPDCSSKTFKTIEYMSSEGGTTFFPSLVISADGTPAVAYNLRNGTTDKIRFFKCPDSSCSSIPAAVDIANGNFPSATIGSDGFPIIVYQDNGLKFTKCTNITCSVKRPAAIIDVSPAAGAFNSITIGSDGLPIISYSDGAGNLKFVKCGDQFCETGNSIITMSTAAAGSTSMAIGADGLPVIAYPSVSSALNVAKCGSERCLPYWTRR